MLLGSARVGTTAQHRDLQTDALRRAGQLPAVSRAHRSGCHDASAHACDEELSTRVGEKGAYQQVNGCCQGDLGGLLAGEQAGERFGAVRHHDVGGT